MLSEVPFAASQATGMVASAPLPSPKPDAPGGDEPPRKQLDLFSLDAIPESEPEPEPEEASGVHEVLEGVIDLAFLEADGWVIADYKTDLGTDPDFAARVQAYRRQVDLYAEAWSRLTGDPVKERVLFFTAQGRVESW